MSGGRPTLAGLVRMGGGCVETEYLLHPHRYDFLLVFFLFLCAAAGGMSCFAQAVGLAAKPGPDPSSLPSRRGTYNGIQSHK